MRGRELQEYIASQVRRRLGDRSVRWLAKEADLPRSTVATQLSRRRFSVEVLVRIADVLERDINDFLPPSAPQEEKTEELIERVSEIIRRAV